MFVLIISILIYSPEHVVQSSSLTSAGPFATVEACEKVAKNYQLKSGNFESSANCYPTQ